MNVGSIVKVCPKVGLKREKGKVGIVIEIERAKGKYAAFFKRVFVIQWGNGTISKCSENAIEEVILAT